MPASTRRPPSTPASLPARPSFLGASNHHGSRHRLDARSLPWQMLGSNEYLRDTVDTSVTEQADFYAALLPWTGDPNPNIEWNQLTMDQPLAQRVP